jgi:dGTPase
LAVQRGIKATNPYEQRDKRLSERFSFIDPVIREPEYRSPFEIDCDRLLYCDAFRRLAGVTQVVAPLDNLLFHNRLTHTLEVAQLSERISQYLLTNLPEKYKSSSLIDPDIARAAALIHDLGHPPFGHLAEKTLDELLKKNKEKEGFDGNAHSFRIVTRLAAHRSSLHHLRNGKDVSLGLDLTRGTLSGCLKYPWYYGKNKKHKNKFGAYHSESEEFNFAREGYDNSKAPSLEAQIMNYADDIAYGVHDVLDFYRAGLIPLTIIATNEEEVWNIAPIIEQSFQEEGVPGDLFHEGKDLLDLIQASAQFYSVRDYYQGEYRHRIQLNKAFSLFVRQFVMSTKIDDVNGEPTLFCCMTENIKDEELLFLRAQLAILKGFVRHYVINDYRLKTIQEGNRKVIEGLFSLYHDAIKEHDQTLIPPRFWYCMEESRESPARLAADIICTLTDAAALSMFQRISGTDVVSINEAVKY